MPSITSLSQEVFNNLGPLTTTYTAPASCATVTNNVLLSSVEPHNFIFPLDCNYKTSTFGDCLPSGAAMDSSYAIRGNVPQTETRMDYFSPASGCPSAWTTVGVVVKDARGSLSSKGVFASTSPAPDLFDDTIPHERQKILMSALANGETAVLCCPSGFEATSSFCQSTLLPASENTYTSGCVSVIPDEDFTFVSATVTEPSTTMTGEVFTIVGTAPITETTTISLGPEEVTQWAAISSLPMITLVASESSPAMGAVVWIVAALAGAAIMIQL